MTRGRVEVLKKDLVGFKIDGGELDVDHSLYLGGKKLEFWDIRQLGREHWSFLSFIELIIFFVKLTTLKVRLSCDINLDTGIKIDS